MSMFELLDEAKDTVCLAGAGGITWSALLSQLSHSHTHSHTPIHTHSPVASIILKKMRSSGYTIQDSSSSSSSSDTPPVITITAPLEDRHRALGIPTFTDFPPTSFASILEALGKAKHRGLTTAETAAVLKSSPNTVHPSLDKLFSLGLLVKSAICPRRDAINPRNPHRTYIYHLKRFFRFFIPEKEGMKFNMDETSSARMEEIILSILEQHGLTKIRVSILLTKMGNNIPLQKFKRELRSMLLHLKDKSRLKLFPHVYCTRMRTLKATPRFKPCIGLKSDDGDTTISTPCTDVTPRTLLPRNLALYEHIDDRLKVAPSGIPTNEMSHMIGLSKKRTSFITDQLTSERKLGLSLYSVKKIRRGSINVNVLIGNDIRVTAESKLKKKDEVSTVELTLPSGPLDDNVASTTKIDVPNEGDLGDVAPLVSDETKRQQSLIRSVIKAGGVYDHISLATEPDHGVKHSRLDKRTACRIIDKLCQDDDNFVLKILSLTEYKTGVPSCSFILSKVFIQERRRDYEDENVSEEVIVDDMIKHYLDRYFIPWRKCRNRGPMLDFIDRINKNEVDDVTQEDTYSPPPSGHKRKDTSTENADDSEEPWICEKTRDSDVFDKLLRYTYQCDALMTIFCMPPLYPVSGVNSFSSATLDMNDIKLRFKHIVRHGAPTCDPHRILSPSDFLNSTRALHLELQRQSTKIFRLSKDKRVGSLKVPASLAFQYPFTIDVVMSRLPVRLVVRNYGIPSVMRKIMTEQLLDKGFLMTEEICYEQRVLEHAIRGRLSMDSLLKDENEVVRDLGKSLLEHAKVQVTRELQFLEDVNCVTLRREADAESSRRLEEQQQQYFYFSKPDPILRNFWRGKELLAFWDSRVLPHMQAVGFDQLDCCTGKLGQRLPVGQCTFDLPSHSPPVVEVKSTPSTSQVREVNEGSLNPLSSTKKRKSKVQAPKKSHRRRVDIMNEQADNFPALTPDIILICRTLWSLFLPQGFPDSLKSGSSSFTPFLTPHESIAHYSRRNVNHPVFWCHPQHQALPNHSFEPRHINIASSNSLLAGVDFQRRVARSFKEFGKIEVEKEEIFSLYDMINRVVAVGPQAIDYLCDNFESKYVLEGMSGEGEDTLDILNDLLIEARQHHHVRQQQNEHVKVQAPLSVNVFISPLFTACMTRTLQVYMTHPRFNGLLTRKGLDTESRDADSYRNFYSNLTILRQFPVSLVVDVHRELYVKKLIKRRATCSEINDNPLLDDVCLLRGGYELNIKYMLFLSNDPSVTMFVELLEKSSSSGAMLTRLGRLNIHQTTCQSMKDTNKEEMLRRLRCPNDIFDLDKNRISPAELQVICGQLARDVFSRPIEQERVSVSTSSTKNSGTSFSNFALDGGKSCIVLAEQKATNESSVEEVDKETENETEKETGSQKYPFVYSIMGTDDSEENLFPKNVGAVHNSYGSDVLNLIEVNLKLHKKYNIDPDGNNVHSSSVKSKPVAAKSTQEWVCPAVKACLLQACRRASGALLSEIVDHFVSQSSEQKRNDILTLEVKLRDVFPYDIHMEDNRVALENDLANALEALTMYRETKHALLYEIPVFSPQYEQLPGLRLFVTPDYVHLHTVNTLTFEGCCPWMCLPDTPTDGDVNASQSATAVSASVTNARNLCSARRNEQLYISMVSTVLTVLWRQPASRVTQLHTALKAVLNVTQFCILLQTMIDAGLVTCDEEENVIDVGVDDVSNLFFDEEKFFKHNIRDKNVNKSRKRSRSKSAGSATDVRNIHKESVSFTHKRFSLNFCDK